MSSFALRSWTEVSRRQITENFRAVRNVVGASVEVMPVVKADAYHHGAVEVSRLLVSEGAQWLAVSSVEEGASLREAGIRARILVMADFLPAERAGLIEYELTPVIHSLPDLREWDQLAVRSRTPLLYHLKIDTGMGRLGARAGAAEILDAVTNARHCRLEGLMTHFASAGDYSTSQTEEQTATFLDIVSDLRHAGVEPPYLHLASTIPVAYGRSHAWGQLVRPGHAIYGYIPPPRGDVPERILDVKPALTWKASILTVKDLPEGSLVGYGGTYRTSRPTRIAVVAAGYADGVPHQLSNKGKLIASGKLVPILGAVSMDVTTIDVTDCAPLAPGDSVTILGREGDASLDAQDIANVAGTISYSVLCNISARVRTIYV